MQYTLKKVIKPILDDISDGIVYLVEAFDSSGDIVVVKMTDEQLEQGGIEE